MSGSSGFKVIFMDHAEIVIIGGSHAGLSAALTLGRARRNVLVIDDKKPRNKAARYSYGFYTRDKTTPADLLHIGREQLAPYDVRFVDGTVEKINNTDTIFEIQLSNGAVFTAKKLLLATGLQDDLTPIPGLQECWGKSAFSCPYCDGWEMRDKKLVIISQDHSGYGFSLLLQQWSKDITLCTNGLKPHHQKELDYLESQNINVIDTVISKLENTDCKIQHVLFADGRRLDCDGVFTHPGCQLRNLFSQQLGCEIVKNGHHLVVDDEGRTTVPGVYAAGDIAAKHSQIAMAVASGVKAAFAINDDFIRALHG